jgi:hypothetical protein
MADLPKVLAGWRYFLVASLQLSAISKNKDLSILVYIDNRLE